MGTLLAKIVIPKMFDFIQAPVALGEGPYKDDNIYAHYLYYLRANLHRKVGVYML